MKAIGSSETSALTRATWRHIVEDGILQPRNFVEAVTRKILKILKIL
jgi:hypothetical protein